jgi:hypothetical protein
MLFGRLLRTYSRDQKSLKVSATWVTRIFVAFDVLSFLTQSAGVAILSGAKDNRKQSKTGQDIVLPGLLMQLAACGFFSAVAVRFHVKMRNLQKTSGFMNIRGNEWRPLLLGLYTSCLLIMLRRYLIPSGRGSFAHHLPLGSAYRVVEFAQGFDGYLASHEVYFYVLEALPMLPPFVIFNIWHPRRLAKNGFGSAKVEEQTPSTKRSFNRDGLLIG